MKMKRIFSFTLSLLLIIGMAMPTTVSAATSEATKTSNKTIKFDAGTYYGETLDSDATIKVTNVTSQKTKDFSVDLSAGDTKVNFSGTKSKVIYCKANTTITLKPNKGSEKANFFGITLYSDIKNAKAVTSTMKYYTYDYYTEKVGADKLSKLPKDADWVIADGTKYTITKPGTYVLYVRPSLFYGVEGEDFTLNPVFIVVKK